MKRTFLLVFIIILIVGIIVGCKKSSRTNTTYNNISKEYLVSEDSDKINDLFWLGQSVDKVLKLCESEGIPSTEPKVMHFDKNDPNYSKDGESTIVIGEKHDLTMMFDKNGLSYIISVYNNIPTKKGIKTDSKLSQVIELYGECDSSVEYKDKENKQEQFVYKIGEHYLNMDFLNSKLFDWSISSRQLEIKE